MHGALSAGADRRDSCDRDWRLDPGRADGLRGDEQILPLCPHLGDTWRGWRPGLLPDAGIWVEAERRRACDDPPHGLPGAWLGGQRTGSGTFPPCLKPSGLSANVVEGVRPGLTPSAVPIEFP